jgi:hypothetical protein
MGNIKVCDLLTKFENEQVETRNGFFVEDGKGIKRSPQERCFFDVRKYSFYGKKVFVKDVGKNGMQDLFNEILVGRAYNASGINAVNAYPLYSKNYSHIYDSDSSNYIESIMTEDVGSLGLTIVQASEFLNKHRAYIIMKYLKDKWKFHEEYATTINSELREYLLQFMTPECLDEWNNLFYGASLIGSGDVHDSNYYFYKLDPNSKKFDGIIAIDNEYMFLTKYAYQLGERKKAKDVFNEYLKTPFSMYLPLSSYELNYLMCNDATHEERLCELNELIQCGDLNAGQIQVLKNMVNYDYEKEIQKILSQYPGIKCEQDKLDLIKYMTEYNRDNLVL